MTLEDCVNKLRIPFHLKVQNIRKALHKQRIENHNNYLSMLRKRQLEESTTNHVYFLMC